MAVVLGLVLTAGVLSGPDKVQEGNYDNGARGMEMSLWAHQLTPERYLCKLWQEEALGGGRDGCNEAERVDVQVWGDLGSGEGLSSLRHREALVGGRDANSEMPTVWTLLVCRLQVPYMWGGGVDDPAFLDDSRLLRARADVARQDALQLAGATVPPQGSTEAAQDLVLEGEALDGNPASQSDGTTGRFETEGAGEGELWWLTTYTCEEGYCGFTASGVQVATGMAACSEHYAFGTRFLVAGRWLVECQDRGSGVVLPNHLDMYFPTAKEAAAWLAQVGDHAEVRVRP
jgi:3D (Asp-Asp-Asp) domain-containing protein